MNSEIDIITKQTYLTIFYCRSKERDSSNFETITEISILLILDILIRFFQTVADNRAMFP